MSESATPPEHWLPVVGYEGFYDVSDRGRVYSHHWHGRILKAAPDGDGYLIVMLPERAVPARNGGVPR